MLLTATGSAQTTVMLIWIVALFAIMYFMMWRPQKKEQNRVKAMLSSMEVGDVVVTTSGFYGVLIDITDDEKVDFVAARILKKYKPAFMELAK